MAPNTQPGKPGTGPVIAQAGAGSMFSAMKWSVDLADVTIKGTLERWTRAAGWALPADGWAVERDFPVMAATSFEGDFRFAVRSLLKTTELTDLQLQPCFYANNVLRVVGRAELCDRMVVTGG